MKHSLKFLIGLVLVASAFNSCSDVNFTTQTSTDSGQGGQGGGGGYVDYIDTITVPAGNNKVDVLLVLDDSGSMTQDLKKLGERIEGLVQVLDNGGVDWQMCYTKTDSSGAIHLWKDKPGSVVVNTTSKVLTPSNPNRQRIFETTMSNIPVGNSGNEVPILAIRNVVGNPQNTSDASCFRSDAALATIIISDEDEKSCGGRCQNATSSEDPSHQPQNRPGYKYAEQYSQLQPEDSPQNLVDYINTKLGSGGMPKTYINHSIVIRPNDFICYNEQDTYYPAFFGVINASLQALTGGVLGNICSTDYAEQLRVMGESTAEVINSVTLRCAPIQLPAVTFNPVPNPMLTYSYLGNKVTFSGAIPANTVVTVSYRCAM